MTNSTFDRIKYVAKNRALLAASSIILFNGYNRTSLEMIRLHVQHKLVKKYRKIIKRRYNEQVKEVTTSENAIRHNKIWILWYQGIDSAPDIVKQCYNQMLKLSNKDVILITEDNLSEYVSLPDYILSKYKKGIISHAHFSDILRVELLYQHGGIWLDSTVFCSKPNLPEYIEKSSLFFYQLLKPGRDGHSLLCSSWAMSASEGNSFLRLIRTFLHDYWSENNSLDDYFLLHIIISASLLECPGYYESLLKVCNSTPHVLLLNFDKKYTPLLYKFLLDSSPVHKLTYRYSKQDSQSETILDRFLNEGNHDN
jgi:hypothetical protein